MVRRTTATAETPLDDLTAEERAAPMSASQRRREAIRIINEALEGGISFMFDDQGNLMKWEAMPDFDPAPRETWEAICNDFDRFRREIKAELRRRLPRNGKILMGTPVL
jgi:hypothetical protein